MMKKRKNVQFIAAAALTAALVTSQFSFATVMGDDTATVQVSSLIPNNVTIDQPVPLSDISLPKSDYGTLSWADGLVYRQRECRLMMLYFVRIMLLIWRRFLVGMGSQRQFTAV